ncbi:hypothetical protein [Coleofasciculus sp. FACHB-SPT36]|uniref:hypothetical protein n=1 Tax=Cyanophyceae TaxID=3028117 RepID=UPI00168A6D1D|nr:hypothetical protein [Coleofasciculus sp. FACHB-SPT36]
MSVIICPGIHDPALTQSFLEELQPKKGEKLLIFPVQEFAAYSAADIYNYLRVNLGSPNPQASLNLGSPNPQASPLIFISFSAGVVGAIGAAWLWQLSGGTVKALIALDGWGMPLSGNFPIHRLSHDYFTHWSSAVLGSGEESFYADPPVEHLELWRSPQTAQGWWVSSVKGKAETRTYTTAAEFLASLLQRYENG